jgi:hypothetical protein
MGALIPNGNDAEVIDRLNTVFSGNKLKKLRRHMQSNGDDLFGSGRHLHRIAHRLKIFPTSGNRPKGRWYVFLRDLIGDQNRLDILQAIKDALSDPGCVGIHFWARFSPGIPAPGYKADITPKQPDAQGQFWITITLLCDHPIDPQLPGDPSKPPADNGEAGPEQPDVDSPAPAAKKATKKTVKKAAKKPYKKAAKKKK